MPQEKLVFNFGPTQQNSDWKIWEIVHFFTSVEHRYSSYKQLIMLFKQRIKKNTFPIVISWQHNENVFEERNESEGPEDKGKNTINLFIVLMEAQLSREGALVDIERGGTEITINHTKTLISEC